jgi:hypothetical protein
VRAQLPFLGRFGEGARRLDMFTEQRAPFGQRTFKGSTVWVRRDLGLRPRCKQCGGRPLRCDNRRTTSATGGLASHSPRPEPKGLVVPRHHRRIGVDAAPRVLLTAAAWTRDRPGTVQDPRIRDRDRAQAGTFNSRAGVRRYRLFLRIARRRICVPLFAHLSAFTSHSTMRHRLETSWRWPTRIYFRSTRR